MSSSSRGSHDAWFESRDWGSVLTFWRQHVQGAKPLPEFLSEGGLSLARIKAVGLETGEFQSASHRKRQTFVLRVGYYGPAYHGFQKQHKDMQLLTVESDLIIALQGQIIKNACGRTDAGVSAISQCVSFTTFDHEVSAEGVLDQFNASEPALMGRLWAFECCRAPRRFHSMYSCLSRKYVYLIPLVNRQEVDVAFINAALQHLEGKSLSYNAFAFGELPLLTTGVLDDECTLLRAYASLVDLDSDQPAICIVLSGNRFLRRMCRSLVASVCRESAATERDELVLLRIAKSCDRSLAAFPAPAFGLCLAGAVYDEQSLDFRKKVPPAELHKAAKIKSSRDARRERRREITE